MELWWQGEVEISKITKNFHFLITAGIVPPPKKNIHPSRFKPPLSNTANKQIEEKIRSAKNQLMKARQCKQERKALQSLVLNSGAMSHYVCTSDNLPIIGPSNKQVHLPNGQTVNPTAQVALLFDINSEARIARLVPKIKNNSLVSIGNLANAGYTTTFLPFNCNVHVHETKQSKGDTMKIVIQRGREDGGS